MMHQGILDRVFSGFYATATTPHIDRLSKERVASNLLEEFLSWRHLFTQQLLNVMMATFFIILLIGLQCFVMRFVGSALNNLRVFSVNIYWGGSLRHLFVPSCCSFVALILWTVHIILLYSLHCRTRR
jgi:hypothetical protein